MSPRSLVAGLIAAVLMASFYVAVVAGASGSWAHLRDQASADWYLIAIVVAGFATQVALVTELRHQQRLQAAAATASGAGVGASTLGMIACCAHHLADLVPFLGLGGAAVFLYDYKILFVLVGVGVNAVGITLSARRLRVMPRAPDRPAPATSEPDAPTVAA
jgi:hypothetical protein